MKKTIAALSLFAILWGCAEYKTSEEMTEPATVEQVIYTPSAHGTGIGNSFGKGGGIVVTSVDIPEVYAVIFKCQHGKFVIQGTSEKHKELWSRMKADLGVTIRYKEKYEITGDGDQKKTRLYGYDFIDAVAVQP